MAHRRLPALPAASCCATPQRHPRRLPVLGDRDPHLTAILEEDWAPARRPRTSPGARPGCRGRQARLQPERSGSAPWRARRSARWRGGRRRCRTGHTGLARQMHRGLRSARHVEPGPGQDRLLEKKPPATAGTRQAIRRTVTLAVARPAAARARAPGPRARAISSARSPSRAPAGRSSPAPSRRSAPSPASPSGRASCALLLSPDA